MYRKLLILLFLCASTFAMVPKLRIPRDTIKYCAMHTPCSWSIYHRVTKNIYENVLNTYCICPMGTTCTQSEDDKVSSTFIFKCLPPA